MFTVTDKDFQQVNLQPWETCEVDDGEWRGYLANYADILEKIDTDTPEIKDKLLADHEARIARVEKAMWLTEALNVPKGAEAPKVEMSEKDIEALVAFLRANGIKNASRKWSVEVLKQKEAKIKAKNGSNEDTVEIKPDETAEPKAEKTAEEMVAEAEWK